MTQKHIGAARGAARVGASGDPKATLQFDRLSLLNLSPLSTELFLPVGCECRPDLKARTWKKRAGRV